ncbi:MAG TPA: class I SAM-dependent methyltransferase [Candidatus Hydrogenedentes bacterium]|nr:class I SAM-dependent methyltransferase [Candidatus Hydrogenedentota bacterium]
MTGSTHNAPERKADTRNAVRRYYEENPLMVSSPFGGVDGVNAKLIMQVWGALGIDLRGRRVLDVGCGRGFLADVVRDLGGEYAGTDLVAGRGGFPLALADAVYLPFGNKAFDVVLCIDAFEHFPEPLAAAREFRRVLRPGGFVFLSVPNYANMAGIVKGWCERFGSYEPDTWAPFRRWQPQQLEHFTTSRRVRKTFRKADFTQFRRLGHPPETGLGLFPWMEHPKMPDRIRFRLQRIFGTIGPALARMVPASSLHLFWRIS